jgi:hypothetical protein
MPTASCAQHASHIADFKFPIQILQHLTRISRRLLQLCVHDKRQDAEAVEAAPLSATTIVTGEQMRGSRLFLLAPQTSQYITHCCRAWWVTSLPLSNLTTQRSSVTASAVLQTLASM